MHDPPWGDAAGAREYWTGLAIPAGGLWSTAADVVRFGQAFLKPGKLLAPATVRAMTSLHTGGLEQIRALGDGPAYYGLFHQTGAGVPVRQVVPPLTPSEATEIVEIIRDHIMEAAS